MTSGSNVNKRLYRAKQKFRSGEVTFQSPNLDDLYHRLDNVFTTLYLLFNEGYYSAHPKKNIRMDCCFEAIRLLREVLVAFPASAKGQALLALMLLLVARFESRLDQNGALVLLTEQNRERWDKELIAHGMDALRKSIQSKEVNTYQLQAGIAAEHCMADSFENTNWASIYRQYQILEKLSPDLNVQFNSCISQFFVGQHEDAIKKILLLKEKGNFKNQPVYYMTLGVLYKKISQNKEAISNFEMALELSRSAEEKRIIQQFI